MKIYEIYDVEDSYPFNRCSLKIGTLKECQAAFKDWIEEHVACGSSSYSSEEEFFDEYPKAELFIKHPKKFIKQYGCEDTEIYFDWKLKLIYSNG